MPKKEIRPDPIVLFLITVRLQRRLSQSQVASGCPSISLRTLQRIEQGRSPMTLRQMREVLAVFDLTPIDAAHGELRFRVSDSDDMGAVLRALPLRLQDALKEVVFAIGDEMVIKRKR